jgi:hypothetical protein
MCRVKTPADFCAIHVTQAVTGMDTLSAGEMNSYGLKGGRRYRVSDTMGVENVGPVLAQFLRTSDMIVSIHRVLATTLQRTITHNDTYSYL